MGCGFFKFSIFKKSQKNAEWEDIKIDNNTVSPKKSFATKQEKAEAFAKASHLPKAQTDMLVHFILNEEDCIQNEESEKDT